MKEEVEI